MMKINYKTILLFSLTAFSVGFLLESYSSGTFPLLWLRDGGISFSPDTAAFLKEILAFFKRYTPHIITIYVLLIAFLILMEGQNPDRTILWLLTLLLLPGLGLILYIVLGPDMRRLANKKKFRAKNTSLCLSGEPCGENRRFDEKLATLLYRSNNAPLVQFNEVELLINGEQKFPRLWDALKKATHYIHLEYFIIQNDALGQELADILCERVAAGVTVRLMFDDVGSWKLGRAYAKRLRNAGVEVHAFMPSSFAFFRSSVNFRNHRKIAVIDGTIAFSGGLNIGVEYLGMGKLGFWRDTHAVFKGDAVMAFHRIFIRDWNFCSGQKLDPEDIAFQPAERDEAKEYPLMPLQIATSGSDSAWSSIGQAYTSMISNAKKRIWITTPYLVPGSAILNELRIAAMSGVDVRILIPSVPDHKLVYWAGRSNIENLLRCGVRIWMYQNGFVHAKTLLMDHSVASVGTANLDTRSLEINFEVQAFIYDEGINEQMANQFLKDMESSAECILQEWNKRPFHQKLLESIGRLWSAQI